MGLFDSIIFTIYTLALMVVSALMVVGAMFPSWIKPHLWLEDMLTTPRGQWGVGIAGLAFFVVSLRLIFFAMRGQGGGRPVVHESELGEVHISLGAVENLVQRTARAIKGVREIKAVVTNGKDGLAVVLKGTISPEVSIPEVSEEIQNAVRQYVKRVVGVEMTEIRLDVTNIANEGRRGRLD
ncbi:MAG: alkaline shock response membrane anchor protein AmaP [Mycobacterium leprae]